MMTRRSTANLLQAQRDFGAHGFERSTALATSRPVAAL
jgi:6-phosphogluconate dehydrogenase